MEETLLCAVQDGTQSRRVSQAEDTVADVELVDEQVRK